MLPGIAIWKKQILQEKKKKVKTQSEFAECGCIFKAQKHLSYGTIASMNVQGAFYRAA